MVEGCCAWRERGSVAQPWRHRVRISGSFVRPKTRCAEAKQRGLSDSHPKKKGTAGPGQDTVLEWLRRSGRELFGSAGEGFTPIRVGLA